MTNNIQLLHTTKGWFLCINEVCLHDGGLTDEQLLDIHRTIKEKLPEIAGGAIANYE